MDQAASQVAAPDISRKRVPRAQHLVSWDALAGLVIGSLMAFGFFPHVLPPGLAGAAWRLACLGYALVCLTRGGEARQGRAMVALFVPFLIGVMIDAAVLHYPACLADCARQLFIIGFAGIVYASARDPVARRVGLWALFVVALAILGDALVRALPALSSGWSYAGARVLKGKSFQNGYNANEVCFAALVALIAGMGDRLVPRWLLLAMMALVGLCSAVLTARAPLLALVVGWPGAGCCRGERSRRPARATAGWGLGPVRW